MPWNENSGNNSPWGSPPPENDNGNKKGNGNGGGGGPWGNGGGQGGGNGGGPDLEDMFRRGQENMPNLFKGKSFFVFLLLLVLAWAATGFYRVQPDQQGVVMTLGKWDEQTREPGLGYHLPWPIQTIITPTVTRIQQTEIGFVGSRDVPNESLMITADENIVDIDFVVQWNIKDAGQYLFRIADPEDTVKIAAESVMREIVGQRNLTPLITDERANVALQAKNSLQALLDQYESGIYVDSVEFQQADPPQQVIAAFNDVLAARQDQTSLFNEATAYANQVKARAEGEAVKLVQQAEAYKRQVVNRSTGEANRFLSIYESYKAAPEVTRKRLYLETLEEVLGGSNKVIMQGGAGGNVLPYLPLDRLQTTRPAPQLKGSQQQGSTSEQSLPQPRPSNARNTR
ncbi:MAG: FtsH protease activity modulator HflK [Alphaproteobacteria bacterium]